MSEDINPILDVGRRISNSIMWIEKALDLRLFDVDGTIYAMHVVRNLKAAEHSVAGMERGFKPERADGQDSTHTD